MKKTVIILGVLIGGIIAPSTGLFAQLTSTPPAAAPTTPVQLDEKTQQKVDKAKADLAKDQEKLTKTTASYEKEMDKFEKEQTKGKLSPDKISKEKKSLSKTEKDIAKLKKNIADNQALIDKYMMPAKPKM